MEQLIKVTGKIASTDGIELFYSQDIPEDKKAIIVIVHGFCEHSGRYEYVKKCLNDKGYGVYRFDNRGHGKSGGKRGHIKNYNSLIDDANIIVDLAKRENPNLPIFMIGHSMGGFITASYGIRYINKLNGQILSGAATLKPPQMQGVKGKFFAGLERIFPTMMVKNGLSKLISRDEEVVKDYESDPLNLNRATLGFHVEFLINGIEWLNKNMREYKYPALILHGGDDKIVNKDASLNLYSKISSKDKELKIYDGLYHEIMNEKEKDIVIKDIIDWLEKRTKA